MKKSTNHIKKNIKKHTAQKEKHPKNFKILLAAIFAISLAQGLGIGGGFANFFYAENYQMGGFLRGILEIPREIPGILCVFLLLWFAKKGDIFTCIIANSLTAAVAIIIAFWTPPLPYLMLLLAINSFGMHAFFALYDSLGIKLGSNKGSNNESNKKGNKAAEGGSGSGLGVAKSISFAALALAALAVFFGTRYNLVNFSAHFKLIFLISGIFYLIGIAILFALKSQIGNPQIRHHANENTNSVLNKSKKKSSKLRRFYALSALAGAQKQVNITFAIWLIINILGQKSHFLAIIIFIAALISIFWSILMGKLADIASPKIVLLINSTIATLTPLAFMLLAQNQATTHQILIAIAFIIDSLGIALFFARALYVKDAISPHKSLTKTLGNGIAFEHICAIIIAFAAGWAWQNIGITPVFVAFSAIQTLGFITLLTPMKK